MGGGKEVEKSYILMGGNPFQSNFGATKNT